MAAKRSSKGSQEKPARGKRRPKEEPEEAPKRSTRRKPGADAGSERDGRVFDSVTRRDILGVGLILLAVVLLLCAALPSEGGALVAVVAAEALRHAFGVGAFILPVFLAAMGVAFLLRFQRERVPARLAIGLTIIYAALLGVIALFTPISNLGADEPALLFAEGAITSHGGYLGAALAWCGITLFGKAITGVVLAGLMLIGAIIIGFSISELIQRLREARRARAQAAPEGASGAFGRILRGGAGAEEGEGLSAPPIGNATLNMLTARGRRHDGEQPAAAIHRPEGAMPPLSPEALAAIQAAGRTQAIFDAQGQPTAAASPLPGVTVPLGGEGAVPPWEAVVDEPAAADAVEASQAVLQGLPTIELPVIGAAAEPAGWAAPEEAALEPLGGPEPFVGEPPATITRRLGRSPEAEGALDEGTVAALAGLAAALTPVEGAGEEAAAVGAEGASKAKASKPKRKKEPAKGAERDGFTLPSPDLLAQPQRQGNGKADEGELAETAERLQETLGDFGIMAEVVGWVAGPTVTLFKVDLPSGVRVSRVTALNDDIALALAAPGVRIFAPIPNTNYVGIEVPNRGRQTVLLSEVLRDAPEGPLQIAIGKDVEGNAIVSDLARMPHLLIGGTTGSGKSVSINAMIMSILMRATPAEVRFIMVDPKRVEFTPYNGIPHLYVPVVTEPKEAASALSWGVAEMERRLKMFSKVGARNISQFNAKVESGAIEGEESPLPYIVIIIDELADLMMNVGKEVEFSISRIAQLARAAGIHLIVATQRPSTNVVTGLIKANITNRIAFNVASGIDSRVILDTPGAENLIGLGDLLLSKPELARPQRIQGCYVSEDEIFDVVEHLKSQGEPEYHSEILSTNLVTLGASSPDGSGGGQADDPLVWEAAEIVVSAQLGSTSNIQRRLKVGYARAGRIMDQLEELGVVGPANGSRPREVLVEDAMELETLKAFEAADEG